MANQTTSDILIAARPAQVMGVIADFESYPEWATGVKKCTVVRGGSNGRAEQVRFVLDASPIKDEYVLAYVWDDDESVTWTLAEGHMVKAMDGAYVLATSATARRGSPTGSRSTSRSR
jgi:hypothetical protein